jgi:hypothetical protein
MDSLPQEVVDHIASLLVHDPERHGSAFEFEPKASCPNPSISGFATISRTWNKAVENFTFQTLSILNTDLEHFQRIAQHDRRRSLRELCLTIVLPTYFDKECGEIESEADKNANNVVFTEVISTLFNILKLWEDAGLDRTIGIRIQDVYSPMDPL